MTTGTDQQTMPVGIIGFGWMGRVHAQANARVRHHYPQSAQFPDLVAIADDVPRRAAEAARQFGARSAVTCLSAPMPTEGLRVPSGVGRLAPGASRKAG